MSNQILLLAEAFNFVTEKHSAQRRKGVVKSPYVNHLAEVANLVAEATAGQDVNLVVAALLHDAVEDVGVTLDDIRQKFGDDVADIVAAVSDDKSLPKTERKRLQIEHAPHLPPRIQILKIADKIANLRTTISDPPEGWELQRRYDYFIWSKKVVDGCRGASPYLEEKFDALYKEGMELFIREAGVRPGSLKQATP